MNRPLGITVSALLSLLDGLLNLLGGYGAFTLGGLRLWGYALPVFAPPPGGEAAAEAQLVLGLGAVLLGLGQLVFAWGAWTLADWAWPLGVGLALLGAALALGGPLAGVVDPMAPMATLLPVLVGAYLLLPGTRRAFGLLTAAEASDPDTSVR